MKIQLVDRNEKMCAQWHRYFRDCPDVSIHCADYFSVKTDCMVSPANSFGFMDGGLDLYLCNKFGWQLEKQVQRDIKARPLAELLVGEAILIDTGNGEIEWLICAPTMRIPCDIRGTVNAYLAAKAIFNMFLTNEFLEYKESISISGLGTGIGMLDYEVCAKQMRMAYDEVVAGKNIFPKDIFEASSDHLELVKP